MMSALLAVVARDQRLETKGEATLVTEKAFHSDRGLADF
jgi:hypothetical protein